MQHDGDLHGPIESPRSRAVKRTASRLRPADRLYQWHMRVGLWIALAVTLWALSGRGHPVISRLHPKATAFFPPPAPRLWQPEGENPVYRIEAQGKIHWADTQTGILRSDRERAWAEQFARHYAGDTDSPIGRARVLPSFNDDYHHIDSLLSVWEFGFDRADGLRAYVDSASGRLATLADRRKDWTGKLFRWTHSWSPIQPSPWVRGLMPGLLLGIAAVAPAPAARRDVRHGPQMGFSRRTLGKGGRETPQSLAALALVLTVGLGVTRNCSRRRRGSR